MSVRIWDPGLSNISPTHAKLAGEDTPNFRGYVLLRLRSPAPRTEYKTPPIPKIHPKIHSRNQNTNKLRKKKKRRKPPIFSYFFCNFFVFWFREGIRGVFWGVFWGSEGFCILYGAKEIAILRHCRASGFGTPPPQMSGDQDFTLKFGGQGLPLAASTTDRWARDT